MKLRRLKLIDNNEDELEKSVQYTYSGPMTVADITLASWNEFFREGGSLNQPSWLQTNRLNELKSSFTKLARLHRRV